MYIHIYMESRKMEPMNLFARQNRDVDVDNRLVDTAGKKRVR